MIFAPSTLWYWHQAHYNIGTKHTTILAPSTLQYWHQAHYNIGTKHAMILAPSTLQYWHQAHYNIGTKHTKILAPITLWYWHQVHYDIVTSGGIAVGPFCQEKPCSLKIELSFRHTPFLRRDKILKENHKKHQLRDSFKPHTDPLLSEVLNCRWS